MEGCRIGAAQELSGGFFEAEMHALTQNESLRPTAIFYPATSGSSLTVVT